jgi:hypothetical protein
MELPENFARYVIYCKQSFQLAGGIKANICWNLYRMWHSISSWNDCTVLLFWCRTTGYLNALASYGPFAVVKKFDILIFFLLIYWNVSYAGGDASTGCYRCCVSFSDPLLSVKGGKCFSFQLKNVWLQSLVGQSSCLHHISDILSHTFCPQKLIKEALVIRILNSMFSDSSFLISCVSGTYISRITQHFAGSTSLLANRWVLRTVFSHNVCHSMKWCSDCEWLFEKDSTAEVVLSCHLPGRAR